MADNPKSLWSRFLEGRIADDLSTSEGSKRACPFDARSCFKAQSEVAASSLVQDSPKNRSPHCHAGCPEPKRPLRPEEFCPEIGKPKVPPSPPCCFIQMQDPCAPCCCPPPDNCDDECRPGPLRDPICGCDLCKKKLCPDGKCCGPTEPSCQKGVKTPAHLEKA